MRAKTCFTYLGYSFYVITVSKKQVSKTSIFELPGVKNCISRLCTNPLGDPPPPPDLIPKSGEKHVNTA